MKVKGLYLKIMTQGLTVKAKGIKVTTTFYDHVPWLCELLWKLRNAFIVSFISSVEQETSPEGSAKCLHPPGKTVRFQDRTVRQFCVTASRGLFLVLFPFAPLFPRFAPVASLC